MDIKQLVLTLGIILATSLISVQAEVYECLSLNNHYTGSHGYDTHHTSGPIDNYSFNVDVNDSSLWFGLWKTGAYIPDVDNMIGGQKVVVRWFVAPQSDLKYTLTVYCKR